MNILKVFLIFDLFLQKTSNLGVVVIPKTPKPKLKEEKPLTQKMVKSLKKMLMKDSLISI